MHDNNVVCVNSAGPKSAGYSCTVMTSCLCLLSFFFSSFWRRAVEEIRAQKGKTHSKCTAFQCEVNKIKSARVTARGACVGFE